MSKSLSGWLEALQAVLALALGAVTLGITATAAMIIVEIGGGTTPLTVTADLPAFAVAGTAGGHAGLRADVVVPEDSLLTVEVTDPSTAEYLLFTLAEAPAWVLTGTIVLLLFQAVRAARRDDPFSPAMARRFQVLGWVTLLGNPVAVLVAQLARLELVADLSDGGWSFGFTPVGVWLIAGVGFLAVAATLRRGAELRDELATVI